MRLLKLGTSDEVSGDLPPEARAGAITARYLEEQLGQPCEVNVRVIWPDERLPGLVERWVAEFQPDLVLLCVNPFWMTYKSTPLRLQRRFGKAGKLAGRAGIRAAQIPWLAFTPPFKLVRRVALRTIGGDYYFEPAEVAEIVEECARQVLAHESAGLVVRGPTASLTHHGSVRVQHEADERRTVTNRLLAETCARLRVKYMNIDVSRTESEGLRRFTRDMVHTGAEAHRIRGVTEGEALVALWRAMHDEPRASSVPP